MVKKSSLEALDDPWLAHVTKEKVELLQRINVGFSQGLLLRMLYKNNPALHGAAARTLKSSSYACSHRRDSPYRPDCFPNRSAA
jgi:hypothetical protein